MPLPESTQIWWAQHVAAVSAIRIRVEPVFLWGYVHTRWSFWHGIQRTAPWWCLLFCPAWSLTMAPQPMRRT